MTKPRPIVHPGLARAIHAAGGRRELAEIVGCKRQNIDYLEANGRPLSPRFVLKAAKALGLSPHEINPDIYPPGMKA